MTDLARWRATVTSAAETPPAHLSTTTLGTLGSHGGPVASPPAGFDLPAPGEYVIACSARRMGSNPVYASSIVGQYTAGGNPGWALSRNRDIGANPDRWIMAAWSPVPSGGGFTLEPAMPSGGDEVWACAVATASDGTVTAVPYTAPPGATPDTAQWSPLTGPQTFTNALVIGTGQNITVGNRSAGVSTTGWYGLVYWVEVRAGLSPGQGPILWRFDATDYPGDPATTWTDPRGRTWNLNRNQGRIAHGLPSPRRATISPVPDPWFTGTG